MYRVEDLYNKHKSDLQLELIAGRNGLNKQIKKLKVHRPAFSLTGFIEKYESSQILVFGKSEIEYLKKLDPKLKETRLRAILTKDTLAIFVIKKSNLKELKSLSQENDIPLFRSNMKTQDLISKLIISLSFEFSEKHVLHGTLVEVFGMGILIQGNAFIGKSEAALGLLQRGHRLISDDIVKIRKTDNCLVGYGSKLTRHLMEIKGIGIINVAKLYGVISVKDNIVIDVVIKLKELDQNHFYNKVGSVDKHIDILGVNIPFHLLGIGPNRDIVLLIETLVLNQRLKSNGYNSAREFNIKLLEKISRRGKKTSEVS